MKPVLYSLDELNKITGGDDQFKGEMITLFISQSLTALEEIDLHAGQKNYQALFRSLHKMKPSVMVMGVHTVTECIREIEEMRRNGVDEEKMQPYLRMIKETLTRVVEELKTWHP